MSVGTLNEEGGVDTEEEFTDSGSLTDGELDVVLPEDDYGDGNSDDQ